MLPGLNLTIFEGGHEMLSPQALVLPPIDRNKNLSHLKILTIGDSNGASEDGWPQQMKKLLPYSTIINKSISGNTIGFDNLGQVKLNTLANINNYLNESFSESGSSRQIDYIFICLGTNDAKAVFKNRQEEVNENMRLLLKAVTEYFEAHRWKLPHLCIITPPPVDGSKADPVKYGDGDSRVRKINKQFAETARKNNAAYLDIYHMLNEDLSEKTTDGIHLTARSQFEIASSIVSYINQENRK